MKTNHIPKKVAFVDLETTGGSITKDRIIEVGIIRIEDNRVTDTFHSLVNPQIYLSPFIENLTNITADTLETAPTFSQIKYDILQILEDCVFVAHNVRFDYAFLRQEFKREDIHFSSKHFCTARLSKYLYPHYRKHNLDCLIERFNLTCENRHRAYEDAKVIHEFYARLLDNIPYETFNEAIRFVLKKPSTPLHLASKDIEALPESPGVYIFFGDNKLPLYVGKSKNIKARVKSHFINDHLSSKEMKLSQMTKSIKVIQTAGELGALIKESYLVKKLQPLYNRQLRNSHKLVVLKKSETHEGYFTAALELVDKVSIAENDTFIAVFKSIKQAKRVLTDLAKEYSLCYKLLGLESSKKACFAYHLKQCHGACLGKEAVLKYNVRFLEALNRLRIAKWPFKGPILIKEENELDELYEGFVVDKWCLLGSVTTTNQHLKTKDQEYCFDWDTYKVLHRYLKVPQHYHHIKEITLQEIS